MKKKDILVVDDKKDTMAVFEAIFSLIDGCTYDVVSTAEEVLDLVKTTEYKIFVLDINLGKSKMHGVDLALLLRKWYDSSKIYAITGHRNLFNNIDPSVAGFDTVFYKPESYADISKQIKKDLS